MEGTASSDRVRLERFPASAWCVIGIVALSIAYAAIAVAMVRPYLFPAGAGAVIAGDPIGRLPMLARPPDIRVDFSAPPRLVEVAPGSPAARAGIAAGARLRGASKPGDAAVSFDGRLSTEAERLDVWRDLYRTGVRGPIVWTVDQGGTTGVATIERPAAWETAAAGWPRRHLGRIVQTLAFVVGALLLLVLRSHDLTAGLCVLALSLSAVAGAGPLAGIEYGLPIVGPVLTVFGWLAGPLAFPSIALAILYFPTRSPYLTRHPWLHAVPVVTAVPLIVPALMTSLYLTGVDAARGLAVWDASHPEVYYAAFAAALGVNVVAVAEGAYRYRVNHHAAERRRIRMALYTSVPGVLGYAVRDGLPIAASLLGWPAPQFPGPFAVLLDVLVLLPPFGLLYSVGVAQVLGPRVVLRRSLQYALARRTLTVLVVLPTAALVLSLVRERHRTIAEIATSSSALYVLLIVADVTALRYRDKARQWLDQRFFREEYDARKILISLASRVRFETDPVDLAALVVDQLDEALHPQMVAILVPGVDEGRLTSVARRQGDGTASVAEAGPLSADGGLVSMLRWSDEPLEIFLDDPRSPAHRLPPDERDWLARSGVVLLVPVLAQEKALIAVIALGERRSEEAYTGEDRQLLASIAGQMALGFDVARLRRGSAAFDGDSDVTRLGPAPVEPMTECPKCGRCYDPNESSCASDGSPLRPVPSVPRTVDNKYRIERLLGRGGMGAVYRARDMRLDRLVALKVVRAELLGDPEARRRFRREAQIVARLQHPSIVAVYDYGAFPDGGAYLVMELVRGEDLRRVIQREGRLESGHAIGILASVCAAIEAAHREGVLHRDLKPENILLPGGGTVAKVLDFGVAKIVAEAPPDLRLDPADRVLAEAPTALTAAGMIVGTPAYMAPEQFHAVEADVRTDVFSLGVIAYEMLSGELPFGRGTLADVILAQARGIPEMPAGLVPAPAETAIRAALDPDPDRRPATPQAFAHLLAAALQI